MHANPFIPSEEFLERRSQEFVDRERRRQDQLWGGWDHDREHDGIAWLSLIDSQRGQIARLVIAGGRYRSFDRKQAVKQLVQISALARRAVAVLMAEIYEAEGEHVDDDLRGMFMPARANAEAAPNVREEIPF